MKIRLLHLTQILSVLYCSWIASAKIQEPNEEQKVALKKAVTKLLDFGEDPDTRKRPSKASRTTNVATKYMQKLFDLYSTDKSYGSQRNVIRSVSPTIGTVRNIELLSFDISSITKLEQVTAAELHLNLRQKYSLLKTKTKKFVNVIGVRPEGDVVLRLSASRDGWLGFDATQLVLDATTSNRSDVNIQVLRKDRAVKTMDIIKRYTPFLLVYSRSSKSADDENLTPGFIRIQKQEENERRPKRSVESPNYYAYTNNKSPLNEDSADDVRKRLKQFMVTGPSILSGRRKHSKSRRRKSYADRKDPMLGFGTSAKRSKRKDESVGIADKESDLSLVLLDGFHTGEKCGKRRMTVNFEDIGWEEYVVEPTSFEASYCSGTCSFRLDKDASSHAIFQSLMHTVRLGTVPNVCCAPDKFDSQTLLYFHKDKGTLELRNFPQMIVTSCACN